MFRTPLSAAAACACLCLHGPVLAAGTSVNEISASGSGVQGAFTASPQDASTIFYNPAGLTELEGIQIEVNPLLAAPHIEYERPGLGSADNDRRANGASLFFSTDSVDGVTLGVGLYAPFARDAKFDNNAALLGLSHRSTIVRTDLAPTVAFRPLPNVSVGLSAVASHVNLYTNVLGLEESARGYGFTANAGVMVEAPGHVRLGMTYRGAMAAHVEGHGTFAGQRDDFNAKLRFPAVLSTGVAWAPSEKLELAVAYDREFWSYFDSFRRNYSNPTLAAVGNNVFDPDDSDTFRMGAVYRPTPEHELRFGVSRVGSAFPSPVTLPSQIDTDYESIAVGYSRVYERAKLSVTYQHLRSEERTTQNPFFPGRYELRGNLLLFGFSYRWDSD